MSYDELYDLLSSLGVQRLIRRNQNLMACCPFHSERRPSFGIRIEEPHLYGCFGCTARGGLYELLIHLGVNERRAKELANVSSTKRSLPSFERRRDLHVGYVGGVLDYRLLFPFDLEGAGVAYCQKRGITQKTATELKLLYDHTQDRLLFPWYLNDNLVGVTGRLVYDDDTEAKTLPYWGTKKGTYLYLPQGKFEGAALALVEGETDASLVYQAEFRNVAALCFARFTKAQKNLVLNSAAREVILFFDDDKRGRELTEEVTEELSGLIKISRVDYSLFRNRYKEELDPGAMLARDIRWAIKHRIHNSEFPMF